MHREDDAPAAAPLIWTNHARKRAQSRGVLMRIVEAIHGHADRNPFVGGGCRSFFVTRRQLARMAPRTSAADRERMEGVVLVVDSKTNAVITVLHPHRRDASRYWRGNAGRRYRPSRRRRHWHPWRRYSA